MCSQKCNKPIKRVCGVRRTKSQASVVCLTGLWGFKVRIPDLHDLVLQLQQERKFVIPASELEPLLRAISDSWLFVETEPKSRQSLTQPN